MGNNVTLDETDESREHRERTNDGAYVLNVDGDPLLFLYLTQQNYVLAWDGRMNYERVHEIALFEVANVTQTVINFPFTPLDWTVHGDFLIASDDGDELVSREGSWRTALSLFRNQLPPPSVIRFARYDVTYGHFLYGMTVANPRYGNDSEIAIERPRTAGISDGIINWILDHHFAESAAYADRRTLRTTLEDAIRRASPPMKE